jgi:hypothetical protein
MSLVRALLNLSSFFPADIRDNFYNSTGEKCRVLELGILWKKVDGEGKGEWAEKKP